MTADLWKNPLFLGDEHSECTMFWTKDSVFFLGLIAGITLRFHHLNSTIKEAPGPAPYMAPSLCFEKVEGLELSPPTPATFLGAFGHPCSGLPRDSGSWNAGDWNNVPVLFQGPMQDPTSSLAVSPLPSVCDHSSAFSCFSWLWNFWRL